MCPPRRFATQRKLTRLWAVPWVTSEADSSRQRLRLRVKNLSKHPAENSRLGKRPALHRGGNDGIITNRSLGIVS
jgi:hypothetical protein